MKEHPILFSPEMVRAYMAGRKWQTRRVIKLPRWSTETWSDFELDDDGWPVIVDYKTGCLAHIPSPYGVAGDSLWVKETFWRGYSGFSEPEAGEWRPRPTRKIEYLEQREKPGHNNTGCYMNKVSSIFMPRWASRISFPILNIRAEIVQEISEADAKAEGVNPVEVHQWSNISDRLFTELGGTANYRRGFACLWDRINAKRGYGWDVQPWWVWIIEFPKYEAHG